MNDKSALPPAIQTVELTKRFGDTPAVDGLSLSVPCGTTLGFIGPNGAGKTTTIKMLMGMMRPNAGRARILGTDVLDAREEIRNRVGYVPEMHYMHRWMRLKDVIGFCRGLFRRWDDRRCDELLKLFQLEPAKRVKQLSKGMLAKLSLVLALSHEPEVLILDEPTSGLDPLIREEFLEGVLRVLCDGEKTVLFSSHTLSDVQRIADNVALLYEGRLLAQGSTDTLVAGTKRIRAVLPDGCTPTEPPEGTIWQRIERREWQLTVHGFSTDTLDYLRGKYAVLNIEVGDLGLEDVFKDFVKGQRASA